MIAAALLIAQGPVSAVTEIGPPAHCFREEGEGEAKVETYVGDRACVDLAPPRAFEGIWLNNFEGSRFIEGVRSLSSARRASGGIWLERHELLQPFERLFRYGRAYRIRFIGRAAKDQRRPPLHGYGHMSMSPGLVVVDRFVTVDDIGPSDTRG